MIQSLDRGLRILDEITAGRRTLSEISASLDVHKSTVLRLLATLEHHHFVVREGEHHYSLGPRISDLAAFIADSIDTQAAAERALRSLVSDLGAPGYVCRLTDSGVVVSAVRAAQTADCPVELGATLDWTTTAAGRVFLATLPPTTWRAMIRNSAADVDPQGFVEVLTGIRRSGTAIIETSTGDAVAVAIRDHIGRTAAVLTLVLSPHARSRAMPAILEARDQASWN